MLKMIEFREIARKLKILYVEDDVPTRASTLEVLENFFDDITVAVDGKDGLKKYEEGSFDIILSDISMPYMSGLEMVKKIREKDKDIAVLFLSAHSDSSLLLESIYLNIDGYIVKPLKLEQLTYSLSKICETIDLKQQREKYQTYLEEEVQKRTKELSDMLHFDKLTSLPNRYSFFEEIKADRDPMVMLIDISHFKAVNEIYGTETGSLVLKEFADFLSSFAKKHQYIAYRVGGDEFMLKNSVDHIDTERLESDLSDFFDELSCFGVEIEEDTINIEIKMGISLSESFPFETAKMALEDAKVHKKAYSIYSSKIDSTKDEKDLLKWKKDIKEAIASDNIVPVYQAIVDQNGSIIKYEALMRLRMEEKLISPYFFLDTAIKVGLYATLSRAIIFEALKQAKESQKDFSINFTYNDILNKILIDDIEEFLQSHKEVGGRVVFEITESESIANYEVVKKFIARFKKHDVRFAIDDFGSGFSNFEYILEIEPDYLKIDGSLVKNIDTDEKSYILVAAIVKFSHKLGIKVIAEFVHNEKVFQMLKALDVDDYQGFYFSEPKERI